MKIIFVENKEKWNKFILENRGSFLQSFEWGELQESFGRKVWRVWFVDEIIEEDAPIFCAQIIKHDLPFGKKYLYIPQGPVYRIGIIDKIEEVYGGGEKINKEVKYSKIYYDQKKKYFDDFLDVLSDICRKENAVFLKMEPLIGSEIHRKGFTETILKKSGKELQPSHTILLDLQKSEEEMLVEMKQKTRYNIRLAQKYGVKIIKSSSDDYFEKFFGLLQETAKRDGFYLHEKDYYKSILNTKTDQFENCLFVASFKNKILAGAMVNFFNGKAVYLHGASSSEDRNVMAPYLLHWEIIKDAKNNNFKIYDFWGISEKWPGVTRFKQGFGGKEKKYLGAFDLVIDRKWYLLYSIARKIF